MITNRIVYHKDDLNKAFEVLRCEGCKKELAISYDPSPDLAIWQVEWMKDKSEDERLAGWRDPMIYCFKCKPKLIRELLNSEEDEELFRSRIGARVLDEKETSKK